MENVPKTHDENAMHGGQGSNTGMQRYLGEFVYGGIDGSVTTFAVVAGATGANLDSAIVLILGFANLLADGLSMSIGAYLSTRSEQQNFDKHKAVEYMELETMPDVEREEVRQIYREKGFEGELLEQVVDVICADKDRWVDTMMMEELGMMKERRSAFKIGAMTYMSFILIGFIPLLVYVWDYVVGSVAQKFLIACVLTGIAFIVIGWLKATVTHTSRFKGVGETVLLGLFAAVVAYYVGFYLEMLLS